MPLEIIVESTKGVYLRFIHSLHLGDYMDFQAKFPQNSTLSLFSEGVGISCFINTLQDMYGPNIICLNNPKSWQNQNILDMDIENHSSSSNTFSYSPVEV